MEKRIIEKVIGEQKTIEIDWYIDKYTPIDELIIFLTEANSNGATHVKFEGETDYDNSNKLEGLEIIPIALSLESDEDFNSRVVEQKIRYAEEKRRLENEELSELIRLKKKYNS